MKIFETTRGRPVAIDAVPSFCPVCGYPAGETMFRDHAYTQHGDRTGWLVEYKRDAGIPAVKTPALLVERDESGPDVKLFVILLERPLGRTRFDVEIFTQRPAGPHARGWRFESVLEGDDLWKSATG